MAMTSPARLRERTHEVKVMSEYYDAVESGEKPFEVRRDDRGYQRGDLMRLRDYGTCWGLYHVRGFHSKRECLKRITYVLTGGQFGIEPGYVVLGLEDAPARSHEDQP